MKRKFMVASAARQWNRLVRKFLNLHRRLIADMKKGEVQSPAHQSLLNKFNNMYAKLARMQHSVGIKLASTALLLGLSATQVQAQTPTFAAGVDMQVNGIPLLVSGRGVPEFADIDRDGDLDLYVGEYFGYIYVYTNNGSGEFTSAGLLQANGTNLKVDYRATPVFADIDRDGDLDLYVGDQLGRINVCVNDGSGTFGAPMYLTDNAMGEIFDALFDSDPTFADINNDGELELYVGQHDHNIIKCENDGLGNFMFFRNNCVMQQYGFCMTVGNYTSPAFADLDRDGDLDLYMGNKYGDIKVSTNNGSGVFSAPTALQAGGTILDAGAISNPVFADLDRDGDLDLYVGSDDGNVMFYENTTPVAPLEYDAATTVQAGGVAFASGSYASPMFEDIDRDGDLDLYAGNQSGTVSVALNNGDGTFTAVQAVLAGGNPIDVGDGSYPAFADLDLDGDMDLYIGNTQGYVKFFENDGTGVFATPTDVLANGATLDNGTYVSIAFADIDTDGDLDLYAGEGLGYVTWYENTDGQGTLATGTVVTDGINPIDVGSFSTISFADLDRDGDLDLYSGTELGVIKVFTNDGSGNFLVADNFKLFDGSEVYLLYGSPTFADIDRDGDLDLYVGNNNGNVLLYEAYKKSTATATGDWGDETTWSAGIPTDNYNTYIGGGEITVNANSNANHVTIENAGKLTLQNGKSLTATNMIIKSDASGTGSFVNMGTLTLSGNSTVQRYLASDNRYYYISSPISNATASVFDDGDGLAHANNKLYKIESNAWVKMETPTEGLTAMRGFAFKSNVARTVNFLGLINDGAQSYPLSGTTGYTLIGNPYTSAIDWGLTGGAVPASWSGNVGSTIWYRVGGDGNTGGNFATYNRNGGGAANGGQRYIPAMQAFWVENTGTGDIGVGNDARVHDGQVLYKNAPKNASKGIYLLINNGDEALVAFNSNATDAYNSTKMFADGLPQIYTVNSNKKLAINTFKLDATLPAFGGGFVVPVGIVAAQSGAQSIAMKDFNDFDASVSVYLEDKSTGAMHNLRSGGYNFDATEGTISDRFVLHFTNITTGVTNANTSDVSVYAYDKMVYVSLSGKQTTSSEVSVFDLTGRLVAVKNLSGFQNLTGLHIAQTGVYVVKVSTDKGITTHKIVIK